MHVIVLTSEFLDLAADPVSEGALKHSHSPL